MGLFEALSSGVSTATPPARKNSCRLPRSLSSAERELVARATLFAGLDGRLSWETNQSIKEDMCCVYMRNENNQYQRSDNDIVLLSYTRLQKD